jgi:hypothetical protein
MSASSVVEQLLERVASILSLWAEVPVYRSRETALARDELPCIVIQPGEEDSESASGSEDKSTFVMSIEIHVRGNPWDRVADPIATRIHPLIVRDPEIAALVARVRRHTVKWEGHDADTTAGIVTRQYRFVYLTPAESL